MLPLPAARQAGGCNEGKASPVELVSGVWHGDGCGIVRERQAVRPRQSTYGNSTVNLQEVNVMATALETAEFIHQRHELLRTIHERTESDTIDYLINPVLEHLGFAAEYRMRENQQDRNRPDFSLWSVPVAQRTSTRAKAIIEAKPLGHDLNGRNKSRAERPKDQLQRYVNGYEFSHAGTFGVLTDGAVWHIVRKNSTDKRAPLVKEFNLFGGTLVLQRRV